MAIFSSSVINYVLFAVDMFASTVLLKRGDRSLGNISALRRGGLVAYRGFYQYIRHTQQNLLTLNIGAVSF